MAGHQLMNQIEIKFNDFSKEMACCKVSYLTALGLSPWKP